MPLRRPAYSRFSSKNAGITPEEEILEFLKLLESRKEEDSNKALKILFDMNELWEKNGFSFPPKENSD